MKDIRVKDIIKITNGKLISGDDEYICKKYEKDSRIVTNGDIYRGIKGEKFDGSAFWKVSGTFYRGYRDGD